MFDRLTWQSDRMLLDDLVFRLQYGIREDDPDTGPDCFYLQKYKRLVDQYRRFWGRWPDFQPRNILELGVWGGGSLVFWFEHFRPVRLVGIDNKPEVKSEYFQRYLATRGVSDRIKTYWETDQADAGRLRAVVAADFDGPLDLVIDDASHLYDLTRTSFEVLFPLLRPGGLYIIEDWSWACFQGLPPGYFFPPGSELPPLVFELVEAAGSIRPYLKGKLGEEKLTSWIGALHIYPDFVALERGEAGMANPADFKLEHIITRSPQWAAVRGHAAPHEGASRARIPAGQDFLRRLGK